eukprot:g29611.t1
MAAFVPGQKLEVISKVPTLAWNPLFTVRFVQLLQGVQAPTELIDWPTMDCRSSLVSPPNDFGSYSLKGELGHGASGRVFECKKKDSNTPLAGMLRWTVPQDIAGLLVIFRSFHWPLQWSPWSTSFLNPGCPLRPPKRRETSINGRPNLTFLLSA